MRLTIFTPTYNREQYLDKLYRSLLVQKNKSFKWIIVDDGSTDKTEEKIAEFIKERKIDIVYFKQNNLGKHIAHNKGVELCDTELFFCVDSDDYLTEDCVDVILDVWDNKEVDKTYSGIVALKGYSDGSIMANEMPKNISESTLSDLYNVHGKKGETALIFKAEHLKNNLFPIFKNEKFLSEEVVYNKIDEIAPLILINKVIYIMEYLEDGMTKNYIKLWKSCPEGVLYLLTSRYNIVIKGPLGIYRKMKVILILNGFCLSKKISILKNTPSKILSTIAYIPSIFVYFIRFK